MSRYDDDLAPLHRLGQQLAALRRHQQFVRDALARHGFDPNQPRVPAGHREGGRWTKTPGAAGTASAGALRREVEVDRSGEESWGSIVSGYRDDGTLSEQRVFNRDGSRIVSEFEAPGGAGGWDERHTVALPDGRKAVFENTGDVQRIYDENGRLVSAAVWTNAGPEPLPPVQLAYLPEGFREPRPLLVPPPPGAPLPSPAPGPAPASPGLFALAAEAADQLFTWLSRSNRRDRTAVLGFTAREYVSQGTEKAPRALWVGYLTEEEVKKSCPEFGKAQEWTNDAAGEVHRTEYETASAYGTAVHLALARKIKEKREISKTSMLSEFSLLKTLDETGKPPTLPTYGEKGSVRLDLLDPDQPLIFGKVGERSRPIIVNAGQVRIVCNYDIKTEQSRLVPGRSFEIARSVLANFPTAERIIVVEIKPRN
jgi:hypothetical protein